MFGKGLAAKTGPFPVAYFMSLQTGQDGTNPPQIFQIWSDKSSLLILCISKIVPSPDWVSTSSDFTSSNVPTRVLEWSLSYCWNALVVHVAQRQSYSAFSCFSWWPKGRDTVCLFFSIVTWPNLESMRGFSCLNHGISETNPDAYYCKPVKHSQFSNFHLATDVTCAFCCRITRLQLSCHYRYLWWRDGFTVLQNTADSQ